MKINAIYKVNDSPAIFASTGGSNWSKLPNLTSKGYLLAHPMWYFGLTSLRLYHKFRRLLKKKNIELLLLHNSKAELSFAKVFGFKSFLINQNIHCRENTFTIKRAEKKYDAVYTAAAKPYKRLHLAEKIESLYIVTYFWPEEKNEKGEWPLHEFEPRIVHADFNRFRIPLSEVCYKLSQSKVGLALSKKEGAMWASMEYMLSGLPIVSTKSVGGRDFFFDDRFVKIVKDDSESIAKGVQELVNKEIDPGFIRTETLEKIEPVRQQYLNLIFELIKSSDKSVIPDRAALYHKIWGEEGIEKLRIQL